MPLGAAGEIVVVGLLIDPSVVLKVKPVILPDALFEVNRNCPLWL